MSPESNIKNTETVSEKFGRVFVLEKNGYYGVVEGIRFCNTSLRILNGNKEVQMYNGRRYAFGIMGQLIKVPIHLGQNVLPVLKDADRAFKKEVEIAKQLRIINDQQEAEEYKRKFQLIQDSKFSLYWILTSPGYDILEQDFLLKFAPFAYLDDLLESLGSDDEIACGESKHKMKLPYKFTCLMSKFLSEAIQASALPNGEDLLQNMAKKPSAVFKKLLKNEKNEVNIIDQLIAATDDNITEFYGWMDFILGYLSFLKMEALSIAKKNGCSPKAFLKHVAEVLDSFCFEYSLEWHTLQKIGGEKDITMLPTVLALRKGTVSGLLCLEAILLQNGIDVGDDVRGCTLFKLYLEQFTVYSQKVNDMLSFSKEIEGLGDEWRSNEACVLHKGLSMDSRDVYVKMAEGANQAMEQMERLGGLMSSMWKGTGQEESIHKFLVAVNQLNVGLMQWYAIVERYHKDIILDCYIN